MTRNEAIEKIDKQEALAYIAKCKIMESEDVDVLINDIFDYFEPKIKELEEYKWMYEDLCK